MLDGWSQQLSHDSHVGESASYSDDIKLMRKKMQNEASQWRITAEVFVALSNVRNYRLKNKNKKRRFMSWKACLLKQKEMQLILNTRLTP